MNNILLKMPITESDSNTGINDGGIETYKNNPMLSLTKEELQNSTDGAQRPNDIPKKVIVEFNDFYLATHEIPSYNELYDVYKKERDYWDNYLENDKKAVIFFDNGIKLLEQDKIRVLRISDFNTTGLTGIHGKSTPWKNLVKNRFVSDKNSYSGGSFGIGKDAAFASSELRTIFYNTYNIENEKAFQGAVKLPSYQIDETNYDGFGFFSLNDGTKKNEPILDNISLDPSFNRKEYGMDKYIIGFNNDVSSDELKKQIIVSSIDNFLYAFYTDKLIVKYGNTMINKDNLDYLFEKYKDDINKLTEEYYETLKNPDSTIFKTVFEDNDVKIFVKMNQDYSKRAAVIRQNGMKVFDKGNINGRIGFSSVIVLTGDKVNAYFKKLENAEHTKWSEFRGNEKEAQKYWGIFFGALREEVSNLNQEDYGDSMDSDGLNEYLPMAYISGNKNKLESLSNEVKEKKIKARKNKKKKKTDANDQIIYFKLDERGDIIEDSINIKPGDNIPVVPVPPEPTSLEPNTNHRFWENIIDDDSDIGVIEVEDSKYASHREIPNNNLKVALGCDDNSFTFKIISKENFNNGFIEVNISGEQNAIKTRIKNAKVDGVDTDFKQNKIYIGDIKENELHTISFELMEKGMWTLEVSVHEGKK
jgi:hypothetical protein